MIVKKPKSGWTPEFLGSEFKLRYHKNLKGYAHIFELWNKYITEV